MANIINDCGARFKDPVLPVAWSEPAMDVERFGCLKPLLGGNFNGENYQHIVGILMDFGVSTFASHFFRDVVVFWFQE